MTFKEPYDQYIGKKIVQTKEDAGVKLRGIIIKIVTHGDNTLLIYMIRISPVETALALGRVVLTKNRLGEYEESSIDIRQTGSVCIHSVIKGVFEILKLAEVRL